MILLPLVLIPTLAVAGNSHKPTAPDVTTRASADAIAKANANASAKAGASAEQAQQQTASADNAGNMQTVNASDYTPRMAPSVAQGSLAIVGCGAGINGGGSNTHGSAFLGIAWTPQDCMALQLAQAYQALGHERAACQVLNSTKAARRAAKRGLEAPACADPVPVVVPAPVDLSGYPSREEVIERDNRVLKAVGSK